MTTFGLSPEVLQRIVYVLSCNEKIRCVKIFGSRALGRERVGSDIDLALDATGLNWDDMLSLRVKLEELMLPYRFDLVNIQELAESDPLHEHIDRVGKTIFIRNAAS